MSGLRQSFYDEGRTEGRAEGRAEGRVEGEATGMTKEFLKNVRNLVENLKWSIADACKALGYSEEDYQKALSALKQ